MNKEMMIKYSKTVLRAGVNIQEGQIFIISAPIHCNELVYVMTEQAYKMGASRVYLDYRDDFFTKLRLLNETTESLTNFFPFEIDSKNHWLKENVCRVAIVSEDPEIFTDCDAGKMAERSKVFGAKIKPYADYQMSNGMRWCVCAYPEKAWAKKVFPNLSEEEAMQKLGDMIIKAMRLDTPDPIKAWKDFASKCEKRCNILNNSNIKEFHYQNSLGTDLTVGMMKDSVWLSAEEKAQDGVLFFANIPTEELFSAPDRTKVNGTLYSALPLVYNGTIIDKFKLIFKDGKVVDYTAEVGLDTLKSIIDTDEGSHYLGEIALVQYDSPISNMKTLFFNTLFDENASCHFAFGGGYPTCVKGSMGKTTEELLAQGLNDSITHEDFMVGTADLNIEATTYDGKKIQIMKDGNFVI